MIGTINDMPPSVNLKEEFCKQILQSDNSIRFAGVANMKGKLVAESYREGLVPLLTKQETELSARENGDKGIIRREEVG